MINAEIDALMQASIASNEPGVAVAFLKDDELIHCQGYGLANLEWEQPITSRTVFGLGSITKPFTATAILLLEKQGKLQLSDAIQTYLPDYPMRRQELTIMHLLTHTSGIPNFVTRPDFWSQRAHTVKSTDEVIDTFKDLPLEFVPGTKHSYSNSGYVLLGRILEVILDMSYAEVIQQLIFDPLGMKHSYFLRPETIIPSRASGYARTEKGHENARYITAEAKYAAGGLGTSLEDMLLWDAALREERLLDHATQERMYMPLQLNNGGRENYGLGWAMGHYRQRYYICHAGGVPGFSTFYGRFPNERVTIILLSNQEDFDGAGFARKLIHLALDLPEPERVPIQLKDELKQKIIGTYSSVFGEFNIKDDQGALRIDGWEDVLVPVGEACFYQADNVDIEVCFEAQNKQGCYTRLRVIMPFFWFTADREI